VCRLIENKVYGILNQQILEDVDGSIIRIYDTEEGKIKVYNDHYIDAVYIDSDVELNFIKMFPKKIKMKDNYYEALREKLDNPRKTVKCPRCGNEIIYVERGNSIVVECKTQDCISGGIRGL
jgi:ribosomal protein S27AE